MKINVEYKTTASFQGDFFGPKNSAVLYGGYLLLQTAAAFIAKAACQKKERSSNNYDKVQLRTKR